MTFDDAVTAALELAGTILSTSYGQPAVKVAANGRAFLNTGHESDSSFVLAMDLDTIEMSKATDPDTFWQTPHYEGWEGVLVRYDTADDERVLELIERSRDFVAAKPPPRSRKRS